MNNDDIDTLNFGKVVISFGAIGLYDKKNPDSGSEKTCGIFFLLDNKEISIVKLRKKTLIELINEIKEYMKKFPDVVEMFERYTDFCYRHNQDINAMPEHPVATCIANKPEIPIREMEVSDRYVKFIHNNAFPDIFKMDISFVNGDDTERFTLISSIIPMFLSVLEQVEEVIN
jgi:hypothetical protein